MKPALNPCINVILDTIKQLKKGTYLKGSEKMLANPVKHSPA